MMKTSTFGRYLVLNALWKSLFATLLFFLFYLFYATELVRNNVEDVPFDIINKFSIHKEETHVKNAKILLFAFDDWFMKEKGLFDEDNHSNYGYTFPRRYITHFIKELDTELATKYFVGKYPKALFIDYDMSFTTMPRGQALSSDDSDFLEILKQKRPYVILIPKTQKANFIESSLDKEIQRAISDKRIRFVSVPLLLSKDDTVRRFQSKQSFGIVHPTEPYVSVNVALWQLLRDRPSVDVFTKDDIIGNRIFLKAYKVEQMDDTYSTQYSYWQGLVKFSAHFPLYEIEPNDMQDSVILLGGTHSQNDDKFSTLAVLGSKTFSGIDIHANALMTMLYLDGSLARLSLRWSLVIVFLSFFILDILVNFIFFKFKFEHEKIGLILLLLISTLFFVSLSVYFLKVYHLWFNWFVPLILFQILEIFLLVRKKSPKALLKIFKLIRT